MTVLDASAVLALLHDEPGAEMVLKDALIFSL
jgi:PIN domain nuclease of toxin-antitoxin system